MSYAWIKTHLNKITITNTNTQTFNEVLTILTIINNNHTINMLSYWSWNKPKSVKIWIMSNSYSNDAHISFALYSSTCNNNVLRVSNTEM